MDAVRTTRQTETKRKTNKSNRSNTEKVLTNKRTVKANVVVPNKKQFQGTTDSTDAIDSILENASESKSNANSTNDTIINENNSIVASTQTIDQSTNVSNVTESNSGNLLSLQITNNLNKFRTNHKKKTKETATDGLSSNENSDDDGQAQLNLKPIVPTVTSVNTINKINIKNPQTKPNNAKVLGLGHYSLLHAYVRDTLFKRIKILSDEHLDTNGDIMQKCLDQVKYHEAMGNRIKFVNAIRMEIRVTMNSRLGYVKRQVGLIIKGKLLV
jgi:hypothetical protein